MPHHHGATASWGISVFLTLVIVVVASLYLGGWMRLRSSEQRISPAHAGSFPSGLLLIWIALASPIAALDHELLTAHMIQHLLLMTLAPPLLWLGEPVLAFSHLRRGTWVIPREPIPRLAKVLTNPAVALVAASAVLVGWHIPVVFAFGMKSAAWHIVEQTSFLATGLLFWWPVVQPWPSVPRRELSLILYLFFATLPCDILSGFLVFCDRVVYPGYFSSKHLFGFSPLGDQQCAAALMWTCITVIYLVAGAMITVRLLSPESQRHSAAASLIQQRAEAL